MKRHFFLLLDAQQAEVVALDRAEVVHLGRAAISTHNAGEQENDAAALQIADWIKQAGYRRGPVTVLFADQLCLRFSADVEPSVARSATGLAYALEESLPIDIEDLVVGIAEGKRRRLAVALDLRGGGRLLKRLGGLGIQVGFVNSLGLLQLQQRIAGSRQTARTLSGPTVWLASIAGSQHAMLFRAGQPAAWVSGPGDASPIDVERLFLEVAGDEYERLQCTAMDDGGQEEGWGSVGVLQFAARCAAGAVDPWIVFPADFLAAKNDAKWGSPLALAAMCVLAAMLFAGIGWSIRAIQYRMLSGETEGAVAGIYAKAFPGQSVPLDVERSLRGLFEARNAESHAASMAHTSGPLLQTLAQVSLAIPNAHEEICSISSLSVEPGTAQIRGDASSIDDLQKLKMSLDAAGFRTNFDQVRTRDFSLSVVHQAPEAGQ